MNISPKDVWLLVDGRRSVDEIAHQLGKQHGTAPEVVADEVRAIISRFEELGLVTRQSSQESSE